MPIFRKDWFYFRARIAEILFPNGFSIFVHLKIAIDPESSKIYLRWRKKTTTHPLQPININVTTIARQSSH